MLNTIGVPAIQKQRVNTDFKGNEKYTSPVDTTPDKDTVTLSKKKKNVKKAAIGAMIVAGVALAFGIMRNAKGGTDAVKGTIKAVKECEGLNFRTPNLNLIKKKYNSKNLYDLAVKYATVANNTKQATGRALLKNEIPKIFKGVEENTLLNELDKLPVTLDKAISKFYPEKSGTISIAGKEIKIKLLGQGGSNKAYQLSDKMGNTVCFKHSHSTPKLGMNNGIIDEVALLNEANKAGVVDVPKLYMANLFGVKPERYRPIEGAWQLVEMIESPKTLNPKGLRLKKWLNNIGLTHHDLDNNSNNVINDIVIDLGMIGPKKINTNVDFQTARKIMQGFNQGKTTGEVLQFNV